MTEKQLEEMAPDLRLYLAWSAMADQMERKASDAERAGLYGIAMKHQRLARECRAKAKDLNYTPQEP